MCICIHSRRSDGPAIVCIVYYIMTTSTLNDSSSLAGWLAATALFCCCAALRCRLRVVGLRVSTTQRATRPLMYQRQPASRRQTTTVQQPNPPHPTARHGAEHIATTTRIYYRRIHTHCESGALCVNVYTTPRTHTHTHAGGHTLLIFTSRLRILQPPQPPPSLSCRDVTKPVCGVWCQRRRRQRTLRPCALISRTHTQTHNSSGGGSARHTKQQAI